MRFSIVAILGLAAFATAQSSAVNATTASITSIVSSISSVASAVSTSLSAEQICLQSCGTSDICCQAACVNVPCPSALQANATTECAAQCPQGNGTQAETEQYAACQARCVSSYFFSSGTPSANPTHAASTGTSAHATTTDTSSTKTGSSSSSTAAATHNAAPEVRFGAAGFGLIGLIIAGLAL